MSQKPSRRTRRKTDDESLDLNTSDLSENGKAESFEKNGEDNEVSQEIEVPFEQNTNGADVNGSEAPESNGNENGLAKEQLNGENSSEQDALNETVETESPEFEPLTQESEEVYPELVFDENSDLDSRKSSPVLSRCKTRRSQTRNIPTPKTPKSMVLEQNGDAEKNSEDFDKQSEISVATGQSLEVEVDPDDLASLKEDESTKTENENSVDNENFAENDNSTDNTLNDEPQNSDFTFHEELNNTYKDRSLGDTMRGLSSRRTIRPVGDYRKFTFNKEGVNLQDIVGPRSSVEKITGVKRKFGTETQEQNKKSRLDVSGFFSYVTHPISHIKTHLTRSPAKSSTPTLTGYIEKDELFENQIDLTGNGEKDKSPNKWCVIM